MTRLLGYWIESIVDDRFLAPQEFVAPMGEQQKQLIAAYLRSGKAAARYRGYSWCRFLCGISSEEMGCEELTDGTWIWPSGLSHYVECHNVRLPDEFVAHIQRGEKLLPSTREKVVETIEPVDIGWWTTWCSEHRSGALLAHLSEARKEAERLWAARLEDAHRQLLKKNGISDTPCGSKNCGERAMNGWNFCATCSVRAGSLNELNPPPSRSNIDHSMLVQVLQTGNRRSAKI